MHIGIGFNWAGIPFHKIIKLSQKAERLGYDSVWVAEDGMISGRDSITLLTCIARETRKVHLGTNILSVYHTRHLYMTALSVAALDQISDGRMIVGIGAGTYWPSYPENPKPLRMMKETIEGLRALLAGETFEYEGRRIKLQDPPPAYPWQVPKLVRARIPLYLAAMGPQMTRLAGEISDGIVLGIFIPPTEVPNRLKHFEAGALERNRDVDMLDVVCNIHIAASNDGSIEDGVRLMVAYWLWDEINDRVVAEANLDIDRIIRIRKAIADGDYSRAIALTCDQIVSAFGAVGTPEECYSQLERYHKAGVKRAILMPFGGDVDLALEIGANYYHSMFK